jgi:hypothetical protein
MTETAAEFIARKNAQWERARDVPIETKDVGRQGKHHWVREAWTWHVQHNYGEKAILIERFRNVGHVGTLAFDGGARALGHRVPLWLLIVGRVGRAAGRWTWAQFSPLIPHPDLQVLLNRARAEGTLLPDASEPQRPG